MYPDAETLAQMVADLVISAEWTSFTILYENSEWLPRAARLLELYDSKGYTVTVRRLDLRLSTKDYRSILRRVKQSSDTCLVIECSIESLSEILTQAQQIGLLIDKYQFIITNLDAHTIDLEPFQYSDAGITLVQMVDTSSAILADYMEYLKKAAAAEKSGEGDGEAGGGGDDAGATDDAGGNGGGEEGAEQPEEGGNEEGDGGGEEGGDAEKRDAEEGEGEEAGGEEGEGGAAEDGEEEAEEDGEGEGDEESTSEATIEEAGNYACKILKVSSINT